MWVGLRKKKQHSPKVSLPRASPSKEIAVCQAIAFSQAPQSTWVRGWIAVYNRVGRPVKGRAFCLKFDMVSMQREQAKSKLHVKLCTQKASLHPDLLPCRAVCMDDMLLTGGQMLGPPMHFGLGASGRRVVANLCFPAWRLERPFLNPTKKL